MYIEKELYMYIEKKNKAGCVERLFELMLYVQVNS